MGKSGFLFSLLLAIVMPALPQSMLPAPNGPSLPAALLTRLRQDRAKDDLQSWIYDQLQWVAVQPGPRSGQLTSAVQSVWRKPLDDRENQAWLDLLVNEGYALLRAGDIVRSTDAYTAAFAFARAHETIAEQTLILNNILKPLGNNYTRLGDFEEAEFIHKKALSIASISNDKEALAGTYSNLANAASNSGSPQQALTWCDAGLAGAPRRSPYRGLLLAEKADALSEMGRVGEARANIRQALMVLQAFSIRPEVSSWLLVAYQQAGDIYLAEPASALQYYQKALGLVHDGAADPRETAKLYLRLGALYRRIGQLTEAIQWQNRCLATLIPGKSFVTLRDNDLYAENTLADLLYLHATLTDSLAFFRLSFSVERRLRQQLVTGSSKEGAVSESRARHEAAIATAFREWSATRSKESLNAVLEFMESSKSQLLLAEQVQRQREQDRARGVDDTTFRRIRLLEKALVYYREQLVYSGGNDSVVATLTAECRETERELAVLRRERMVEQETDTSRYAWLPDDGAEVRSFFCGEKAVFEIALDHGGILFADRLPLDSSWEGGVRQFLHRWFGQGPNNMIDKPQAYFDQAHALYRELFASHPLRPGRHYIILPDGALDLVPIEALPAEATYSASPANWPLVVRQTTISYAWSMQTLGDASQSSAKAGMRPSDDSRFTGLFITANGRQFPALRAVTDEQQGIARRIRGGSWLIDTQATCGAFEAALDQSAVVHLSSHASSGRDPGSIPRIELADSPFYMFRLMEMQHHPILVFLSACRTGDGRVVAGEGVQSMARAFTAAGTNGVITGWWNVHDEVAAQLVGRFYAQLGPDVAVPDALAAAKRSWLTDPAVPYLEKLPWYWAALNYQGARTSLPASFYSSSVARVWSIWWILWVLPFLVLAIWYFSRPRRSPPSRIQ